jgi:hypothetical protein
MTFGPEVEGAPGLYSVAFDLAAAGYATHEHFVSGTATGYAPVGAHGPDGVWEIANASTAPFTTRVVIYCPSDPARANGTVIVEWLNVTGGLDIPAIWMPTQRHLLREGYTWVGVSAQAVSVHGGGMMPGLGLRQTDPDRYGALEHPGDVYSYDLFTQVARALRTELPDRYGIPVERVFATGASQSAFHLTTYVNAFDGAAEVFDGFLIGGRAGKGAPVEAWEPLSFEPGARVRAAREARLRGRDHIRADARVPVIVVQSETDVLGVFMYVHARQPDTERFRLWEVAGSAHSDSYFLFAAAHDTDAWPAEDLAAAISNADDPMRGMELPINSGPQMHYVLERAVDGLDAWVRDGTAPPTAPRLEVNAAEDGFVLDELGVARGGVRTPWVDAPTAVVSGLGQPGDMTMLFGTTTAIDPVKFAVRYPGGREQHAREFAAATRAAVDAGYLLAVDAAEIEELGRIAGARSYEL